MSLYTSVSRDFVASETMQFRTLPVTLTHPCIFQSMEGSLFPRDPARPIINLYWNRLLISVDWNPCEETSIAAASTSAEPTSAWSSGGPTGDLLDSLDLPLFTSRPPLSRKPLRHLDGVVTNHSSHDIEAAALVLLIDKHRRAQQQGLGQSKTADFSPSKTKGKSRLKKRRSNDSNRGGPAVSDEDENEGDGQKTAKVQRPELRGLTLTDCLSAFTKEERLEDESWCVAGALV